MCDKLREKYTWHAEVRATSEVARTHGTSYYRRRLYCGNVRAGADAHQRPVH